MTLQIRCPSASATACNGSVKLQSVTRLKGRLRTLGLLPFQAPAGKKRNVTFTLSGAHARMLKGRRVSARVFIVARDDDGRLRTTTARLTIVG